MEERPHRAKIQTSEGESCSTGHGIFELEKGSHGAGTQTSKEGVSAVWFWCIWGMLTSWSCHSWKDYKQDSTATMGEHSCYQGDEASLGQHRKKKLRKQQEAGRKKTENNKFLLTPPALLALSLSSTPYWQNLKGSGWQKQNVVSWIEGVVWELKCNILITDTVKKQTKKEHTHKNRATQRDKWKWKKK